MRRAFSEVTIARTHALLTTHSWSPAPPWVAGSPVTRLAAAGLDFFCGAQRLGKAATWCPHVVFCPQAQAGHVR